MSFGGFSFGLGVVSMDGLFCCQLGSGLLELGLGLRLVGVRVTIISILYWLGFDCIAM